MRQRDLELPRSLRGINVYAGAPKSCHVIVDMPFREHVESALTAIQAIADKRQKRIVFVVHRAKKSANMPVFAKHGASERNRRRGRARNRSCLR
ncbi:hypothetical protein XH80_04835 [Bradyrhizobium sp. CCBAU 45384]|nr:hypothetical protein [Bradyrhizobium sp. CCBAU 45384]